jgi:uncharacterized membrane protein YdjX (TVP38/TMEM64 family)
MTGADSVNRSSTPVGRGRGAWKAALFVAIVVALAAGALLLPVRQWLGEVLDWTAGLGYWGPFLVAGLYVVACVLMLPGSALTLGAGALFGLGVGTVTVSVGSTLGAAAAFLVGRFVARDWVARKIATHPKFAAIDEAVGKQGFRIVLLTRLSPAFPFNFLNYAYGLTGVPLWKYFLASWTGMLPGTVMYVYIGSLVNVAAGDSQTGTLKWVLYGVGFAATIAVTVVITRIARRSLNLAVQKPGTREAGEKEG